MLKYGSQKWSARTLAAHKKYTILGWCPRQPFRFTRICLIWNKNQFFYWVARTTTTDKLGGEDANQGQVVWNCFCYYFASQEFAWYEIKISLFIGWRERQPRTMLIFLFWVLKCGSQEKFVSRIDPEAEKASGSSVIFPVACHLRFKAPCFAVRVSP